MKTIRKSVTLMLLSVMLVLSLVGCKDASGRETKNYHAFSLGQFWTALTDRGYPIENDYTDHLSEYFSGYEDGAYYYDTALGREYVCLVCMDDAKATTLYDNIKEQFSDASKTHKGITFESTAEDTYNLNSGEYAETIKLGTLILIGSGASTDMATITDDLTYLITTAYTLDEYVPPLDESSATVADISSFLEGGVQDEINIGSSDSDTPVGDTYLGQKVSDLQEVLRVMSGESYTPEETVQIIDLMIYEMRDRDDLSAYSDEDVASMLVIALKSGNLDQIASEIYGSTSDSSSSDTTSDTTSDSSDWTSTGANAGYIMVDNVQFPLDFWEEFDAHYGDTHSTATVYWDSEGVSATYSDSLINIGEEDKIEKEVGYEENAAGQSIELVQFTVNNEKVYVYTYTTDAGRKVLQAYQPTHYKGLNRYLNIRINDTNGTHSDKQLMEKFLLSM